MTEQSTLTRRDVAHAARVFATEQGITEGHGSRGRVSANVVFQYLVASKPATVREIGTALGIEVPAKGHPSEAILVALTDAVTKNAPKAAEEPSE